MRSHFRYLNCLLVCARNDALRYRLKSKCFRPVNKFIHIQYSKNPVCYSNLRNMSTLRNVFHVKVSCVKGSVDFAGVGLNMRVYNVWEI